MVSTYLAFHTLKDEATDRPLPRGYPGAPLNVPFVETSLSSSTHEWPATWDNKVVPMTRAMTEREGPSRGLAVAVNPRSAQQVFRGPSSTGQEDGDFPEDC